MLENFIFISMRGQFLISYEDDLEVGGDYLNVYSNGTLLKRIYRTSNNLYSIPIYTGNVITFEYVAISGFTSDFDLIRRDYTTDDVSGDYGIKETSISSGDPFTTYTFTATTISTAYDFSYILTNNVSSNFQIWTEASDPILTENNDYINRQY